MRGSARWGLGLIALAMGAAPLARGAGAQKSTAGALPVVLLTTQQDHDRQMKELKISGFPPGPAAYQAGTYDEVTATPYPKLPDPLVMKSGTRVTTAAQWKARRAEIVEYFDREVYGRAPKNTPAVKWELVSSEKGLPMGRGGFGAGGAAPAPVSDVPVITKQLIGHVDNASYPLITVNIGLTVVTPANATGPVPIVMQFGGGGPNPMPQNDTPNPCAPPPGSASAGAARGALPAGARAGGAGLPGAGRGPVGPNWQAQLLAKGWGYAMLNTSSIQADSGCGLTVGIIGLTNQGQPRKMDDWGSLRALAWGADRAMDYFETDKSVDAKRVGVEGHSRWGKATLVTMAYDERFAIGYVSSSGEGGAKLHRRQFGERVDNLTAANEYHWVAGNFMNYGGRWDALPVDSHELIALVAPRPLFLSAGSGPLTNPDGSYQLLTAGDPRCQPARGPCETQPVDIMDAWADAKGTFMAGSAASPVYTLLGKKGLGTTEFPGIETGLMDGDLTFRQHAGPHTDAPNWPVFIQFAEREFKAVK
ncbi:MAG: acetylxylan esterase [Acidobacteriota bacterium]